MNKPSELTILYHGKSYQGKSFSWPELCRQFPDFTMEQQSDIITVPAQKRFLTTLALLYCFIEYKTLFPVASFTSPFFEPKAGVLRRRRTEEEVISSFALAVATSGTQTAPKIALISRNNIISHCQTFNKMIPLDKTSIWLNCMPLNHIAGIMIIYRCWFRNVAMLLHDSFNVKQIWDDLHCYLVTHISLVPRMLSRLLDYNQDAAPPEHLRYVIVGGDKLSDSLYQRAISSGWPIFISYGMTEATSTVAIGRSPEKLKLLDGFDAQVNVQQELKLKGSMIIAGYAESKISVDEQHWFQTRDLVELDGSYLNVIARNDQTIIVGGENIAPETLEQLLMEAPGIDDIAIGKVNNKVSNESRGDTIGALVCGDVSQFKRWLLDKIQYRYQPRFFVKIDSIPRNSLGKVDRKAIQELLENKTKDRLN